MSAPCRTRFGRLASALRSRLDSRRACVPFWFWLGRPPCWVGPPGLPGPGLWAVAEELVAFPFPPEERRFPAVAGPLVAPVEVGRFVAPVEVGRFVAPVEV